MKFKPPTLQEVESYVKEKSLQVDPEFFFEYFTVGKWIDSRGNHVKNWKQKILTWHRQALMKGKRKYCYCGQPGVYLAGHDDTGQPYFRCIDHKPKHKPTINGADKLVKKVPENKEVSISDLVNRQKNILGVN